MDIGLLGVAQSRGIETYQYISPRPGATLVSPHSSIIIRHGEPIDQNQSFSTLPFYVAGNTSGVHTGEFILSDDSKTLIFKPDKPFYPGEVVVVELRRGFKTKQGTVTPPLTFSFTVSATPTEVRNKYLNKLLLEELDSPARTTVRPSGKVLNKSAHVSVRNDSLPPDFPLITVDTLNNPTPGYLFTALYRFAPPNFGPTYLAIIDNYGTPIFYRKLERLGVDLKPQPNGLLTYFEGPFAIPPGGNRYFYALDQTYTIVDSFYTGNGYITDLHELLILPNDHALLMSYDPQIVRMDTIVPGGLPNAVVIGLIIQEIDANKNVVFQWRSWDHFQITDADSNISLTDSVIDYVHGNAIEVDYDGNLLISSRHLNEITKIDRQTGDIIWRWGGENNQFMFINDNRRFSHQHHIRRLPNGNYTLFDNGNFLNPEYSSALEYQLDQQNLIANLVWSYRDTSVYAPFMGSVQRLSNANTVIGWGGTFGSEPSITEVRPNGIKALEITFEDPFVNYRAVRAPWDMNIFFADRDSLIFGTISQSSDTATLNLINNTSQDIFITTASTRTTVFAAIDTLPLLLPANGNTQLSIVFSPADTGTYKDVLTIRADRETEGFGRQIVLMGEFNPNQINPEEIPQTFVLRQNYPNPFNPLTTIEYSVPIKTHVTITIFDLLGREVLTLVDRQHTPGNYTIVWNGKDKSGKAVQSGLYIYRLKAGIYSRTRKMILLR
ncbi:MAG: T9SS C-terminal target domain-containing protein [Calditrichaeota bacterium]|nr:MAG: T9SS C-terminal target domain-containing protein [Calditrichota bacterium]